MTRRQDRHEDEDRHDEGHDARHGAALIEIAHHGGRDDARAGGAEALDDAADDHRFIGRREAAHQAADHEEADPGIRWQACGR